MPAPTSVRSSSSADNLPRPFRRMHGEAEQAERADILRREMAEKIKPFGFDSDLDQRDNPVYPALQQILAPSIRSDIIRQMLGSDVDTPKLRSLWENYLPKQPSDAEMLAADTLLRDPNLSWGTFLNDPVVEEALVDNVIYRFLDDLSQVSSYVDNSTKVLAEWKVKCPGSYKSAEGAVDIFMDMAYRTVRKPENQEALDAIRQVRMLAHCMLHGHITGRNEFAVSTDLGGASRENILLNSPTLDRLSSFNRNAYFQVARMDLGVIEKGEYQTAKPPEQARTLRSFLEMPPDDKRNPFELLFDRLIEETNPQAICFQREGGMKFSPDHCINQLTRAICPILAMDVQKLRQKNMEPTLLYNLYKLSRHLRKMDIESVYPMLGTGMLPTAMPPGFVLRFDPTWMKKSPVAMLTPAALASAGFNPIVHEGMRDVVAQVKKLMPTMMETLEKADTVTFLKRAHTRDILIEPVRVTILQREFLQAYRSAFRDAYQNFSHQELKKIDPVRFGSMGASEFKGMRENTWFDGISVRDRSLVRSAIYKAALKEVAQNPDAPQQMEGAMMAHRGFKVMELRLHPSLRGVFPAQPSANVDYSGIKAPASGAMASFEMAEYPYLQKDGLNHSYLSAKHFDSLCVDGKGVLSPEMVAMQGIFTTANSDMTLAAYVCNHPALREKQRRFCTMLTRESEETGIMLIPYQLENYQVGDTREPMNRIRTVRTTPKYLSAMSEALKSAKLDANPLYLANVLLNPDMLKVWAKIMVTHTANPAMDPVVAEKLGNKLLEHLQFGRFATGLKDPSVPVFAIEGEKKSLSVLESQLRQFEHALKRMFDSPNPESYDFSSEKIPKIVIPIGTIGVWNTVKVSGSSDHVLNPAILRSVALTGRTFIIAQDADGKNNPSVTAAAAMAATQLKKSGATPMYWKPPVGPGKGFDDWVEAQAKDIQATKGGTWRESVDASYALVPDQLLPRCKALRTGLLYSDLTTAQAKGADLQEFITTPASQGPTLDL